MTRAEVNTLVAKTDPQLLGFVVLTRNQFDNYKDQRDDAIARINAFDAAKAALIAAHQTALAQKDTDRQAAIAQKDAERDSLVMAHTTSLAEKQAVIDEKQAKLAVLENDEDLPTVQAIRRTKRLAKAIADKATAIANEAAADAIIDELS